MFTKLTPAMSGAGLVAVMVTGVAAVFPVADEMDAAVGIAITHDHNGTVKGLELLCQEAYYQVP